MVKKLSTRFVYFAVVLAFVVAPQAQVFRSGVYTVQVSVTVTDANGRRITGLSGTDFEVFEDGDQQPITQFSDQRVPVSLGVMLDASDSMRARQATSAPRRSVSPVSSTRNRPSATPRRRYPTAATA